MQFKLFGLITLVTTALAAPAALESRFAPNGANWSVTGFRRSNDLFSATTHPLTSTVCVVGTSGANCQYSFAVEGSRAFYQDNGPAGGAIYNPLTGSFSDKDCGGGYGFSWGYNPAGFAVMTLTNGPKVAWVGYDNVVATSDPSRGGNGKFPDKTSPVWS